MEARERRARLAWHIRMIALLGDFEAVPSKGDQGMAFVKNGERWVVTPFGIERSEKVNAILEHELMSSKLEDTLLQLDYYKNKVRNMADSMMVGEKETVKIMSILSSNDCAEEKVKKVRRYLDSLMRK